MKLQELFDYFTERGFIVENSVDAPSKDRLGDLSWKLASQGIQITVQKCRCRNRSHVFCDPNPPGGYPFVWSAQLEELSVKSGQLYPVWPEGMGEGSPLWKRFAWEPSGVEGPSSRQDTEEQVEELCQEGEPFWQVSIGNFTQFCQGSKEDVERLVRLNVPNSWGGGWHIKPLRLTQATKMFVDSVEKAAVLRDKSKKEFEILC